MAGLPAASLPHTMNQSRLGSLIEACINTAIGFAISMVLAIVVYPMFGAKFSMAQNFWITFIFTVASVIRSYAVRRAAQRIHAAAQRLAAAAS